MKIIPITLLIATLLYAGSAWTECLSYDPSVVSLSGRLESRTYPGPPNYEDISKGDKAETGFYIVLDNPICVKGEESSPMYYPQNDVTLVQLVLNEHGYEKFRPFLNKSIKVRGKLFGAHTGHHHAPLLLDNVNLEESNR